MRRRGQREGSVRPTLHVRLPNAYLPMPTMHDRDHYDESLVSWVTGMLCTNDR